jgi:hypothetical protein
MRPTLATPSRMRDGTASRAAPMAFATPRADALGVQRAAGIDEAVQFFIEDDLATQKAPAE